MTTRTVIDCTTGDRTQVEWTEDELAWREAQQPDPTPVPAPGEVELVDLLTQLAEDAGDTGAVQAKAQAVIDALTPPEVDP